MCEPASFVLTKTQAYWCLHTDSHEEIMRHHKLRDGLAGNIQVARVEVLPPARGDVFSNPKTWKFHLDQERAPHWYKAKDAEQRARLALKDWLAARVFKNMKLDWHQLPAQACMWIKDCQGSIVGGDYAWISGKSKLDINGLTGATIGGEANVTAYNFQTLSCGGNAKVHAGRCSGTVYGTEHALITAEDRVVVIPEDYCHVTLMRDSSAIVENQKHVQVYAQDRAVVRTCNSPTAVRRLKGEAVELAYYSKSTGRETLDIFAAK